MGYSFHNLQQPADIMGFFTSSSKFFMYLLTSIFMLLGLAVLAAGLYMRFDTTQWDTMQSIHNGRLSVYIYMILGAAIFLLSIIGQYGAGKARRRFSLFVFQLGTLACLAVSIWGALVLFQVVNDSTTACIGDNCRTGDDVSQELSNNLTQQQLDTIHKYQRPFAIFLACVAPRAVMSPRSSWARTAERSPLPARSPSP